MKRIAILSGSYQLNMWNNLGRLTRSLSYGMQNLGYQVTVLHPIPATQDTETVRNKVTVRGIAVPSNPRSSHLDVESISVWNNALQNVLMSSTEQYDALLLTHSESWDAAQHYRAHNPSTQIVGWSNWLFRNNRWIQTSTNESLCNQIILSEFQFLVGCDKLVAHSQVAAANAADASGREIFVVPCASMWQRGIQAPENTIVPKPNSLLYLGRLNRSRNIEYVIHVAAAMPWTTVTVAGPEDPGPYGYKLKVMARELGMGERFQLRGWSPTADWKTMLWEHELVVVPGSAEPYGYGTLDAMQNGSLVLPSVESGVWDYLGDDAPTFSRNLPDQIKSILNLSDDEKNAIRKTNRHRALTNYHSRVVAETLDEVLCR